MLLSLCLLFVFLVDCLLIGFWALCMDEDKEPSFVVNFYIVSGPFVCVLQHLYVRKRGRCNTHKYNRGVLFFMRES